MFSSCGQVAEGRSVLHFTTSCPCTDSTEVVMQEEDSLEPPAPPQTADEDLRGLDIFLHPQIQPFAQI